MLYNYRIRLQDHKQYQNLYIHFDNIECDFIHVIINKKPIIFSRSEFSQMVEKYKDSHIEKND